MNGINEIVKSNARAQANAQAEAQPLTSYTARPNGDVLIAYHPAGGKRITKTLSGTDAIKFNISLSYARTKTGKLPQRAIDNLIRPILEPAPVFTFHRALNGNQATLVKTDAAGNKKTKALGPRKSARFFTELDGITVSPVRAPRKHAEAVSRLIEPYFA